MPSIKETIRQWNKVGLVDAWADKRIGLEKEAIRVDGDGLPARTKHPEALGHKLTHPNITTDFAENQLELVTGPQPSFSSAYKELTDIQAFAAANIGAEHLWSFSMPPRLTEEEQIPIAQYGQSNAGRIKELYRVGLATRYGRKMQTISGVHFNYSLGETFWQAWPKQSSLSKTEAYMGLMRNFRRYGWLITYLFGAAPAVDSSFFQRRVGTIKTKEMHPLGKNTLYGPGAVSLRMSKLGYINTSRCSTNVSYNTLSEYIANIQAAVTTDCPDFSALGLEKDGFRTQLNPKIMQIENEYYSTIRAKAHMQPGERPLSALARDGISYIEIRAVDIDPSEPVGIGANSGSFIELFLLYCLLAESPPIDSGEERAIVWNQNRVSLNGLDNPNLKIAGQYVPLLDVAETICTDLKEIAAAHPECGRVDLVDAQIEKLRNPATLPSLQLVEQLKRREMDFHDYAFEVSKANTARLRSNSIDSQAAAQLKSRAAKSLVDFKNLPKETVDFSTYLETFNRTFEEHPVHT